MRGEQALVCSAVLILMITMSAVSFILTGAKYQLDLSIYYHQKQRRSLVPVNYSVVPRLRHDATQRMNLNNPMASFLPEDEPPQTPDIQDENNPEDSKTISQPKITITLMVAMSSAILACLVLICILAMRTCPKTDHSSFSHTTTFEGSLTQYPRKVSLEAFPTFPRVMQTDESILDLTLYGTPEGESVSPMSSAIALSSEDSDDAPAVQEIMRRVDPTVLDRKGITFMDTTHTATANTESCSDTSRPESRDDDDNESRETTDEDFVYDLILASSHAVEDLGLVVQDPFCAVTHPVVVRVEDSSPFAGRLCPGDFLLSVNHISLMGKSGEFMHQTVAESSLVGERCITKFTVMTSRSERDYQDRFLSQEVERQVITVEV